MTHIVPYLPLGGYKGPLNLKIGGNFTGNLEIWAALIAIGDKGYRNGVTKICQLMRPHGPLVACRHWGYPVNTTRDIHSKHEKHQILVCWQGALPPATPIKPYLGGSTRKKANFLKEVQHLCGLPKTAFKG